MRREACHHRRILAVRTVTDHALGYLCLQIALDSAASSGVQSSTMRRESSNLRKSEFSMSSWVYFAGMNRPMRSPTRSWPTRARFALRRNMGRVGTSANANMGSAAVRRPCGAGLFYPFLRGDIERAGLLAQACGFKIVSSQNDVRAGGNEDHVETI